MILDSWMIARLARELEELLRGARVQNVLSSATSLILFCYRRGADFALHVVLDQNAPLVALEQPVAAEKEKGSSGWAASVAALLRGCTVDAIHAVPNDRVVFVDVSSRSAFGLPSLTRIVLELQPRKANALVLRSTDGGTWVTVAAAKQFDAPPLSLNAPPASDQARSVIISAPYLLPPAMTPRCDRAQFIVLADKLQASDAAALARLLGDFDPACTPPLAREVVHRVLASDSDPVSGSSIARRLLTGWETLRVQIADALENDGPVYVYAKDQKIIACHLVPLSWPLVEAREIPRVNELILDSWQRRKDVKGDPDLDALAKRLTTMLSRCRTEVAALQRALSKASAADELRKAGEIIYSNLSEIPKGAKQFADGESNVTLDPLLSAKENAAQYFKRYKKARSGLPQIEARLRMLDGNREYWEQLLWELDRARASPAPQRQAAIAEIKAAIGIKERKAPGGAKAKREERKVELSDGATAYVGRSPKDNERLTFTVASPNDYWFHARGIPGAHVIVKTDRKELTEKQIHEAAALAAAHSRGSSSASIEVDFTQRKHVRRQAGGRPGLVWYDHFETIRVSPNLG
ncbi:MAG: NFACT RNA binding domain-containing protein [Candidatus Eremiobacteraeota bacterium]|nr:NFACT RNA binding domain-containing protein [Candidatus Eremiobacteraeota bacterium]